MALFSQLGAAILVDAAEPSKAEFRAWMLTVETNLKGLYKRLTADATGQNVATAQPWFPTAGGVSLEANTAYFFHGILRTSRAAGSTSHTTGLSFGGTATLHEIDYFGGNKEGDANDPQDLSAYWKANATTHVTKDTSTSTTEQSIFFVWGSVRINAAGTFIPQFIYSAAPGGAPTILRGTYFRLIKLDAADVSGTWA